MRPASLDDSIWSHSWCRHFGNRFASRLVRRPRSAVMMLEAILGVLVCGEPPGPPELRGWIIRAIKKGLRMVDLHCYLIMDREPYTRSKLVEQALIDELTPEERVEHNVQPLSVIYPDPGPLDWGKEDRPRPCGVVKYSETVEQILERMCRHG